MDYLKENMCLCQRNQELLLTLFIPALFQFAVQRIMPSFLHPIADLIFCFHCILLGPIHLIEEGHQAHVLTTLLTPLMLCSLILCVSGDTCSVTSTLSVVVGCLFSLTVFAWDPNPSFTSNKPTHYLLGYGNFTCPNHFLIYGVR